MLYNMINLVICNYNYICLFIIDHWMKRRIKGNPIALLGFSWHLTKEWYYHSVTNVFSSGFQARCFMTCIVEVQKSGTPC